MFGNQYTHIYILLQHALLQRAEGAAVSVHAALPNCHGRLSIAAGRAANPWQQGPSAQKFVMREHRRSKPELGNTITGTVQKLDDSKVSAFFRSQWRHSFMKTLLRVRTAVTVQDFSIQFNTQPLGQKV